MVKKLPNISARDFGTILNMNPYQTPFQLLEQKIENKYPFFGNKFTDHGNKYEKVAIEVYETNTGNVVENEQRKLKHDEYDWITGKIDGLTTVIYINDENENKDEEYEQIENSKKRKRNTNTNTNMEKKKRKNKKTKKENKTRKCVIEVKCPLKEDRTETLTVDNVPKYYWCQCQVYMNILNCDVAHYIEYYIKPGDTRDNGIMYYVEIKKDENWWKNSLIQIKKFYEEIKKYHELGCLDTHPVRIEEQKWMKIFC